MKRAVAALVLFLACAGCGEVTSTPQRCHAAWCRVASGAGQRLYHAAVWTGDELLVWGGLDAYDGEGLASGWRVNPKTGRARPIDTRGAPSARWLPFAAWTGREMLIWGGETYYPTPDTPRSIDGAVGGAAYDPEQDRWRPIADPRRGEIRGDVAAWTGQELFVWGGGNTGERRREGFLFDPALDTTRPVDEGIPEAAAVRADAVAVDGSVVITGGETNVPEAHPVRYDVSTDSWQLTAAPPPVPGSDGAQAPVFAHDGRAYFCSQGERACGVYSLTDDAWETLALDEAMPDLVDWPAWAVTPHELVFFGIPSREASSSTPFATSYDFDRQTWDSLPTTDAPQPLRGQSATWIDSGILFWGGANPSEPAVIEQGWLLERE